MGSYKVALLSISVSLIPNKKKSALAPSMMNYDVTKILSSFRSFMHHAKNMERKVK